MNRNTETRCELCDGDRDVAYRSAAGAWLCPACRREHGGFLEGRPPEDEDEGELADGATGSVPAVRVGRTLAVGALEALVDGVLPDL